MPALKLTISDVFFNFYNGDNDEVSIIEGIKEFFRLYPYFNEFFSIEELRADYLKRL